MIDGNFGKVSAVVLFSKVAYQRKRWLSGDVLQIFVRHYELKSKNVVYDVY